VTTAALPPARHPQKSKILDECEGCYKALVELKADALQIYEIRDHLQY
jgi:hypothetical protein